jgi:capsular exopolysaccharide synthesis family protein
MDTRGLSNKLEAPEACQAETQPILRIGPSERYPLVLDHSHAAAAESFGILRSRLLRAHTKHGVRSVLVTSVGPEDGKTLTAVNLSLSLGQLAQKRVLLIDADLRGAGATPLLKLEELPGLGELLSGSKTAEDVIYPTSFSHLSVLPKGHVPEKSLPELLAGPAWQKLIEFAKERYDLIVVDTVPAVAPVVDLELLSGACDAMLLVVRIRKTIREDLSCVRKRLEMQKLLGVVINSADELSEYNSSYYYSRYSATRNDRSR